MRHGTILSGLAILALSAGTVRADGDATKIRGEYLEARTCSVWVGSCFSNSEANLIGKNAILTWAVKEGSWNGETLDGLKVVALLSAEGTLQTKYEGKIGAVVFVDRTATPKQADALVAMAKELAPDHLGKISKVEKRGIEFARKGLEASVTAGADVKVKTGPICRCDSTECHAYLVYPAFSKATQVECAKAEANQYKGEELGVRWSDPDRPSAMVGTFAR
ncbi:MAG TPA: DUF1326 domain-containing protein [Planctomycetota bacterium]|jgi:hypothetical protein|nr:DUF1326 domain-containing protein [Planctomycetota bacterium]